MFLDWTPNQIVTGYNWEYTATGFLVAVLFTYAAIESPFRSRSWYICLGAALIEYGWMIRVGFWSFATLLAPDQIETQSGFTYPDWAYEWRVHLVWGAQISAVGAAMILHAVLGRVWIIVPVWAIGSFYLFGSMG